MDGEGKRALNQIAKLREHLGKKAAALETAEDLLRTKIKMASAAIANLIERANESDGAITGLIVRVSAGESSIQQLASAHNVTISRVSAAESNIQTLNQGGVQLRNRVSATESSIVLLSARSHVHV